MVSGDWFYYPSIGGDSHYIDTPKKGDLEEIPREEIPWDLESWRIPVTMVVSIKTCLVVWNIWIIFTFSWECHHSN